MNDNEQRDELAREHEHLWLLNLRKHPDGEVRLFSADGKLISGTYAYQVTRSIDATVQAATRKPRTIMERFEDNGPDELAPFSVVLSNGKPAIMQHDGTFLDYDGSSWDVWEMSYPLTVIHEPTTEATP